MPVPDNVIYEFGPFLLEPQRRRLSRDGETVPLAAPEFELLLLLVRNGGRVVEKREIMEAVWPDAAVEENNLTVRMSSLRRALGETKGHHPYIQTVTGRGYCLITPVTELSAHVGDEPEAKTEQPAPSASPLALLRLRRTPRAARRKWRIGGHRLYTFFVVVSFAISLVYGVLQQQKEKSEASDQPMRLNRVTHSGRVVWAAVSPDGQNIAYVERDGELCSLWLQRAGTNSAVQLRPPATVIYKDPAFSRDGNTLYYSKCEPGCNLNKMPVLGGVETTLPIRADCPVTFSPDGKRMAYVRVDAVGANVQVNLLVANADGTDEETLNSRNGDIGLYQNGAAAWSPDGKIIAFPIRPYDGGKAYMKIVGVSVADRAESTLTSQRWRYIQDVAWLPDGSSFIMNARDEASAPELALQIWRVSYPGGKASRITNDLNNYMRVGVSADGNTLMALDMHWTYGISIAPAEDPSAAEPVTRGTIDRRDGYLGLSMMPDGRLLYVSDFNGKRDLWTVNADGTSPTQLTDGPHKDIYPAVTSDGRYVVFESTRENAHSIWRVDADGRNPTRLTRGAYDAEPVCSPDGKWVVYVAYEDGRPPVLRRVSIEGGDSVVLTQEFSEHPAFSPDGKVIAYYRMDMEKRDRRDIVFIPSEGGAPIKTLPAPKNFGSFMRWAPAGDSLSYRDNTFSGVWRLPLNGTPPSQIMNLRVDRLLTFCYSPDGRRFAYASGPNLTDVVLITRFN